MESNSYTFSKDINDSEFCEYVQCQLMHQLIRGNYSPQHKATETFNHRLYTGRSFQKEINYVERDRKKFVKAVTDYIKNIISITNSSKSTTIYSLMWNRLLYFVFPIYSINIQPSHFNPCLQFDIDLTDSLFSPMLNAYNYALWAGMIKYVTLVHEADNPEKYHSCKTSILDSAQRFMTESLLKEPDLVKNDLRTIWKKNLSIFNETLHYTIDYFFPEQYGKLSELLVQKSDHFSSIYIGDMHSLMFTPNLYLLDQQDAFFNLVIDSIESKTALSDIVVSECEEALQKCRTDEQSIIERQRTKFEKKLPTNQNNERLLDLLGLYKEISP